MSQSPEVAQPPDLTLTRILNAPRQLVWKVWTDPVHCSKWYGPDGFTTPVYEADLRPGGTLRVHMRAPDGTIFPQEGTFEDVVAFERIVTVGEVEIGGSVAFTARTIVTFADEGNGTRVDVVQSYSNVAPIAEFAMKGAPIGWAQQFEKLEAYLAEQQSAA